MYEIFEVDGHFVVMHEDERVPVRICHTEAEAAAIVRDLQDGYEIVETDGVYVVTFNGEPATSCDTREDAVDWIDEVRSL